MFLLFKGFVLWIFYNKNFSFRIFRVALLFICQGSIYYFSIIWLSKIPSGEDGIWTHAPLLTTYSLSRGAPSASLGTSPNGRNKNGEGGIRTHAPLRTNGFQDRLVMTTSIPLHILYSLLLLSATQELLYQIISILSTTFFIYFSSCLLFWAVYLSDVFYLITHKSSCQHLFLFFLHFFTKGYHLIRFPQFLGPLALLFWYFYKNPELV